MSIRVMSAVWDSSRAEGTTLLVLLALADHCDDYGIAWPSLDHLAHKSRVSKSTVQRALEECEGLGELHRTRRGGTTNLYRVTCGKPEASGQSDYPLSGQSDQLGWSQLRPDGVVTAMTTESSRTVKNRAGSSKSKGARTREDLPLNDLPPMPDPTELAVNVAGARAMIAPPDLSRLPCAFCDAREPERKEACEVSPSLCPFKDSDGRR